MGLWTIRSDKLEGEENRKFLFGAIMTVAIAFIIAELGDNKTQPATIALATKFSVNPIGILMVYNDNSEVKYTTALFYHI